MTSVVDEGLKTVPADMLANAPISCNNLKQNNQKIILKAEAIEHLTYIKSTIDRQKARGTIEEFPFAMLGHKDENGNVIIEDIIYEKQQFEARLDSASPRRTNEAEAVFSNNMATKMTQFAINTTSPVIIHGHTHPHNPNVNDFKLTTNYSLADLNNYQDYQDKLKAINPNAEVLGMVVNEIGDFNVIGYNASLDTFERL